MKEAPTFLRDEADPVEPETVLRPALAPRRGEWIAWLCTLGTAIGSLILMAKSGAVPALGVGLTLFFLLAAGLISYGNWIDRSTEIRWNDSGIEFHSPLRSVVLPWGRVDAMWAVPTARSWRIAVRAGDRGFAFRTGGSIRFGSSQSLAVGFPQGEALAATIRRRAALGPAGWDDGRWLCRRLEA